MATSTSIATSIRQIDDDVIDRFLSKMIELGHDTDGSSNCFQPDTIEKNLEKYMENFLKTAVTHDLFGISHQLWMNGGMPHVCTKGLCKKCVLRFDAFCEKRENRPNDSCLICSDTISTHSKTKKTLCLVFCNAVRNTILNTTPHHKQNQELQQSVPVVITIHVTSRPFSREKTRAKIESMLSVMHESHCDETANIQRPSEITCSAAELNSTLGYDPTIFAFIQVLSSYKLQSDLFIRAPTAKDTKIEEYLKRIDYYNDERTDVLALSFGNVLRIVASFAKQNKELPWADMIATMMRYKSNSKLTRTKFCQCEEANTEEMFDVIQIFIRAIMHSIQKTERTPHSWDGRFMSTNLDMLSFWIDFAEFVAWCDVHRPFTSDSFYAYDFPENEYELFDIIFYRYISTISYHAERFNFDPTDIVDAIKKNKDKPHLVTRALSAIYKLISVQTIIQKL